MKSFKVELNWVDGEIVSRTRVIGNMQAEAKKREDVQEWSFAPNFEWEYHLYTSQGFEISWGYAPTLAAIKRCAANAIKARL